MSNHAEVMRFFLSILNKIKVYHWQTNSYARHKATDELHANLSTLVDQFIEVLTGRTIAETNNPNYRITVTEDTSTIKLKNYSDKEAPNLIIEIKKVLENNINSFIGSNTELANIRDEMLAEINKVAYLFSLQ
jgi:DNA-binding ferritin-like protein